MALANTAAKGGNGGRGPLRVTLTIEPGLHRQLVDAAELMQVSLSDLLREGAKDRASEFLKSARGKKAVARKMRRLERLTSGGDNSDDLGEE